MHIWLTSGDHVDAKRETEMRMDIDRNARVVVRMRHRERAAIEEAAANEGERLSEWVRRILIAAAQRRVSRPAVRRQSA